MERVKQIFVVIVSCLSLMGMNVFAEEGQTPAIIVNNTGGVIDVYVLLPAGGAEQITSIEPGQQSQNEYYQNEVIMVTPTGSDDIISQFNHDGSPNKVYIVEAPVATSGARGGMPEESLEEPEEAITDSAKPCPKDRVNCDTREDMADIASQDNSDMPEVIVSDEFKEWLETDKVVYSTVGRTIDETEVKNAFQNQWLLEDKVRHGYNILKMDPGDLTDSGIRTPRFLFERISKDSKNWHWDLLKIALANDLVLYEAEESFGQDTTTMSFTSYEELESTSTSVGLGAEYQGKKGGGQASTKNGNGVKGKIGWGRDEGKLESNSDTLIRKEQVGRAYWACYVKEHMQLDQDLKKVLLEPANFSNYSQYKDFFEKYGTHWPLCTYFGGWIRYEERMSNTELSEHVKKSFSVSVDAKVPAGKAPVAITGSYDHSKTNETRNKESSSTTKANWESKGGTLGAGIGMWQMQEPQNASSYIPVQLELRSIYEIIWPELMGITEPKQVEYIHRLRVDMAKNLDRYISEAQGPTQQYDWKPRLYEAKITKVVVSQDDDEGTNNEPDFAGTLSISESNTRVAMPNKKYLYPPINTVTVWSKPRKDAVTLGKGKKFDLGTKSLYISVPATPVVDKKINGKTFYKPSFDLKDKYAVFFSSLIDVDDSGKDESASGTYAISLKDVESQPNKIAEKKGIEFADEGVGVKMSVQVRRVDYDFDSQPQLEPALAPEIDRAGEGDAIAAREVSLAIAVPETTSGSASSPSSMPSGSQDIYGPFESYVFFENAAISGHNKEKIKHVSVAGCKAACNDRNWCQSFDYDKKNSQCDLSEASYRIGLKTDYPGNPYDHYSKMYRHFENAAISGHNNEKLKNVSVEQCKTACNDRNWCQSFDYDKNRSQCDLSDVNQRTVTLKTDYPGNPYDHYSKE
jgi:hypothetical protein